MLCKQISTKTVFGDKEKILETVMKDKNREHFLYRVFGVIEANQVGKGRHKRIDKETGEAVDTFWTKFFGEFFAVNAEQAQYEASACFLPEYVSAGFSARLESGLTDLTFAYDIFAVYNKDSITSYEFIAMPVKREGEVSKLQSLMSGDMPALPTSGRKAVAMIEAKDNKKK